MEFNLKENINTITPEFISERIPTREEDRAIYASYREAIALGEKRMPVFVGTEGVPEDYPTLTHYGFAMLSLDQPYMTGVYLPAINGMFEKLPLLSDEERHLFRASLIEFALLGCKEAQNILYSFPLGRDWDYIAYIVEHRWPNLQRLKRFLNAQNSGAVPFTDEALPNYSEALGEIRAGGKRKHWIWYIFPQMYGIAGTHSQMSLYFGIRGRMEAYQYICHPVLRQRMIGILEAIVQSGKTVCEIFPEIDALKTYSCIKLFSSVSDIDILKQVK